MNDRLNGILPVLPTPFTGAGAVDMTAMPALVNFAKQAGAGGVVFPGFASEVELLSAEERLSLLRIVTEAAGSELPVIAGASADTADAVAAHGRHALDLGAHCVMIQPPKSIGSDAVDVIAFFEAVTGRLPDIRIILQNAPQPRGSDLTPETILQIVNAVPQVVYVKEETLPAGPAITAILEGKPEHLLGVIGGGGARYILDEYARGACAAMPAIELTGEHVAMDRAWHAGDKATARDLYVCTLPLLTLQAVYRMRLTKYVMMRRGILRNAVVRAPMAELDDRAIQDIDANLFELGVIDMTNEKALA